MKKTIEVVFLSLLIYIFSVNCNVILNLPIHVRLCLKVQVYKLFVGVRCPA